MKAILIGGNLTNHPVVRHEILKAVTARKGLNPKVIEYLTSKSEIPVGSLLLLCLYTFQKTSARFQ